MLFWVFTLFSELRNSHASAMATPRPPLQIQKGRKFRWEDPRDKEDLAERYDGVEEFSYFIQQEWQKLKNLTQFSNSATAQKNSQTPPRSWVSSEISNICHSPYSPDVSSCPLVLGVEGGSRGTRASSAAPKSPNVKGTKSSPNSSLVQSDLASEDCPSLSGALEPPSTPRIKGQPEKMSKGNRKKWQRICF